MFSQPLSSVESELETAGRLFDHLTALAVQIGQLTDELDILNITVQETRKILQCSRVIIYQLLPRGDGVIIAESVGEQWISILGQLVEDPCFRENWIKVYQLGRVSKIEDIYAKPLEYCYIQLLERFQVRANLVVPILIGKPPEAHLWGLLIAHQCDAPRQWYSLEIKLLQNIAAQVGITLWNQQNYRIKQEDIQTKKEEELRQKETLLRSMTDSSLLGFFVVDNRTDNILYFNHRFCEIWGIEHLETKMELGQLKNNDIIPDCIPLISNLPAFIESCKPLQNEENRATIEDEILFNDGRTIRRFSSQIRDKKDQYFGRLYIFEDITKSQEIKSQLKISERRWKYALEGSGDGVWDWNIQTNEVFFSCCWKEMLGFRDDEISNNLSEWDQRLHPDDKAQVYEAITQHFQGETEHYISEHRVKCKDGNYKWILDRGQVFSKTPDGQPLRMIGTHTDITERKRIEEALRESEERYRSVIDAMAEGIVLQQANGQIIACNKNAEKILGLTTEQMLGRTSVDPCWRAIHEDGSPFLGETHPAMVTLQTGQPQTNVIMGVHKPNGELTWISINSQPLFESKNPLPYAVLTSFSDITEKRMLEIELQQSEELFRAVFEQATVGAGLVDSSGKFIRVNERFCHLLGYSQSELRQINYVNLTHPDDRELNQKYGIEFWTKGIPYSMEKRYIRKDGQIQWVNLTASPIYNVRGELQYALGIVIDISERKQAEIIIHQQAERERMINAIAQHIRQSLNLTEILQTTVTEVRKFLQTDWVIIYRLNPDKSRVIVTESIAPECHKNSCYREEICVWDNRHKNHNSHQKNRIISSGGNEYSSIHSEVVVPIVQNTKTWGLLVAYHCHFEREWQLFELELLEQLATQVAIAIQQSELHEQLQLKNQELENLVLVDPLTQIANRRGFDHDFNHEWQRLMRQKAFLSLLLCDIDYFKQYNDTYGHSAGDECLKMVAQTLQKAAQRSTDLVARYGGEEFVIILPNTDCYGAIQVAFSVNQALGDLKIPHRCSKVANYVTISIGVATMIPREEKTPINLLDAADRALYQAKEQGRNGYYLCQDFLC